MGREKKAGFCFNNGLISTFQLLFFCSSKLVEGSFQFAHSSWQLAERGGGITGVGTHSSFHGRPRELPPHTLLFPSLFLSPQSLVKEPVVPSQGTAVTKPGGSSGRRRKWCFFTKSLRMFDFTTSVRSP